MGVNVFGKLWRNANNEVWKRDYYIVNIRAVLETTEAYYEGRDWEGFYDPFFVACLRREKRFLCPYDPPAGDIDAIAEDWLDGDLYGMLLRREGACSLEWVDLEALKWFETLLVAMLQSRDPSDEAWGYFHARCRGWYTLDDSVRWYEY